MRKVTLLLLIALASTSVQADLFNRKEKNLDKEREAIREMRAETLKKLYELNPKAKDDVQNSEGVAVFSSLGFNVLLLSTARGGGIAQDTKTGEETFMKMLSVGGGVGLGVKDFRVVFVFHTRKAFDAFLTKGWDFSGQGDAAVEAAGQGTSVDLAATVINGVSLYQITEQGLALQATLQGTKYYANKELNAAE